MTTTRTRVLNGTLAAVLVAGAAGTYFLIGDSATAQSADGREVTVRTGTVTATISASGNAESGSTSDVSFTSSGTVTAVYVKAGDRVKKNQALAKVDPTEAQKALATAGSSLASARAQLASSRAQQTLSATKNKLSVKSAKASVASAEDAYVAAKKSGNADAVSKAKDALAQAENQLAQAQAQADADSASASTAQQQASVTSAEENVAAAEATLEETTLRAPQAGTVMSVAGAVGDEVSGGSSSSSNSSSNSSSSGGSPAGSDSTGSSGSTSSSGSSSFVTIADLDDMQVTANVAEADVADVKKGQKAQVTLSATDTVVAGTVTAVSLQGTTSSNVVNYPVTVTLDEVPSDARLGASVSLVITTGSKSDVLTLTSSAITTVGNTSTVTVRRDGKDETVRVETGLVGNNATEITSGLSAGDVVVVPTTTTSTGTSNGFPSLGGGGFPGGGAPGGRP